MEMTEFSFGVSFCQEVYRKNYYREQLASVLQSYAMEGNVYCVHVLDDSYLTVDLGVANYGRFTGDRLLKEPLRGPYSETMHVNLLKRKRKKIFFFSHDTCTDLGDNFIKIINLQDFAKFSEFFYKREALQIRQDQLAPALYNTVSGSGSEIEIREPYLKGKFISELFKYKVFEKSKVNYHFSVFDEKLWDGPNQWTQDEKHRQWAMITKEHYKKMLMDNAQRHVDKLFDYHFLPGMNAGERKEAENKITSLKNKVRSAQKNGQFSIFFYNLKPNHFESPFYKKDRSGHWHHRFLRILDNKNLYTFESSHSFIYKRVLPHWHPPGEYLHFRHAKNEEFDSFKKAFDEPMKLYI